jgi:hypothetical protein
LVLVGQLSARVQGVLVDSMVAAVKLFSLRVAVVVVLLSISMLPLYPAHNLIQLVLVAQQSRHNPALTVV